jgi:hypothetical protein
LLDHLSGVLGKFEHIVSPLEVKEHPSLSVGRINITRDREVLVELVDLEG